MTLDAPALPDSRFLKFFRLVPLLTALACLLYGGPPRAALAERAGGGRREGHAGQPRRLPGQSPCRLRRRQHHLRRGDQGPRPQQLSRQLGRLLGDKWEVKNFGHSGATLLKNGDSPYVKTREYPAALEFKPDVVVIFLGTNDSKPQNWKHKDDYAADYKELIGDFRKADPKVRVYLCLPVPAPPPGNFGIRDEVIKDEIIPLVKTVAADTHATVIDLYSALSDKKELFPDRVHPNAAGAELMAKVVYHDLTGKEAPGKANEKVTR